MALSLDDRDGDLSTPDPSVLVSRIPEEKQNAGTRNFEHAVQCFDKFASSFAEGVSSGVLQLSVCIHYFPEYYDAIKFVELWNYQSSYPLKISCVHVFAFVLYKYATVGLAKPKKIKAAVFCLISSLSQVFYLYYFHHDCMGRKLINMPLLCCVLA